MALKYTEVLCNVNRLQVMQNKLLKLILKLDKFTSTNVLHRNMKILKIADAHVCNTLGVLNEMGSNRCPEIFKIISKSRLTTTI